MILKSFEIEKKNIFKFKFFLIYGENEGLKKEIIKKIKTGNNGKEIKFEEAQILKDKTELYNEIKNKSLFDEKRIYLIDRCTDKISEIVTEICENKNEDLIILNCGVLEKKSKLRNYMEKSKYGIIVPTYKDNSQSLINIAKTFFNERKISISYETLNLLVNRCNGDRGFLTQELEKISNYLSDKKIISLKEISVLTNLSENYSAAELVDASLNRNIKRACEILDESNYFQEDIFMILRIFLQKAKRIMAIMDNIDDTKDIDKAIAEFKPTIFWKDKPTVKRQLQIWTFKEIKNLIYELNDIEIKIKKNNSLGLILTKNFIYEMINKNTNNSFLSTQ